MDLIKAAKCGDSKRVQALLAADANVHALDDWALRWASRNGHLVVVQTLLRAGASPAALPACLNYLRAVRTRWLLVQREQCASLPTPYFKKCVKVRALWRRRLVAWRQRAVAAAWRPPCSPMPSDNARGDPDAMVAWLRTGGRSFARQSWIDLKELFGVELGPNPFV